MAQMLFEAHEKYDDIVDVSQYQLSLDKRQNNAHLSLKHCRDIL